MKNHFFDNRKAIAFFQYILKRRFFGISISYKIVLKYFGVIPAIIGLVCPNLLCYDIYQQ